jgi:hypothetical protein
MLLRSETLHGIERGTISLAFRRWKRPTVRSGGTLLTGAGQLEIGVVRVVSAADITEAEAVRAGFASKDGLLAELNRREEGDVYRIELRSLKTDPRIALRESGASDEEIVELRRRLERLDMVSASGSWTQRTLLLIRDHSGVRAGDLCLRVEQDRDTFKRNVRKLKALGLTESLEVGYRLSRRGADLLRALGRARSGANADPYRSGANCDP